MAYLSTVADGSCAPVLGRRQAGRRSQRFGHRVADLLAARAASGSLPRYALLDLAHLCDDLEQPRPPEFTSLQALLEEYLGR